VVALGLFLALGLEEIQGRPEPIRRERAAHAGKEGFGTGEEARLEERGRDADVGQTLALTIVDGAHAVTDLETDVPEKGEELFDIRLPVGGIALRQQHHDVDIRTRMQLAAAVAADRHQRQIVSEATGMPDPRGAQRDIHQASAIQHQILDGFVGDEALFQEFGTTVQDLAKNEGRELSALQRIGRGREVGPVGRGFEKTGSRAQEAAAAAGSAAVALRVRTS
jgi:hypothetical protein